MKNNDWFKEILKEANKEVLSWPKWQQKLAEKWVKDMTKHYEYLR